LSLLKELDTKRKVGIVGCKLNAPPAGHEDSVNPRSIFNAYLDVTGEDPWIHEFYTTFSFLKFLGCSIQTVDEIKPELWLTADDQPKIEPKEGQRKTIGLFPGASHSIRSWNVSNFLQFIGYMGSNYQYVLLGSKDDYKINVQLAEMIASLGTDYKLMDLTGKTTLRELYATISSCSLLVSMETAALHLGIVSNIPTIGIVGGGHYGRFVPWGDPAKHLFMTKKTDCFHCNWKCCKNEVECIKSVSPQEVAFKAAELLQLQ
jgi:ADP-heptose:LPS heptosyltransferase